MKFKFIDLFSGIGGFRLALEALGGECVFSSEIDKYAAQVYFNNFGEHPEGDIKKIDESKIPDHHVLCAGFPCQPFSQAGKLLGFEDSRGTLFFDIYRIAKEKKPNIIYLENVSNIVNHDKGNTIKVIRSALGDLGYELQELVINAKDFGIPQNRNRWYCIAIRKDTLKNQSLKKLLLRKRPLEKGLREILAKNSPEELLISKIAKANISRNLKEYKRTLNNNYPLIANNIRPSKVSFSNNNISPCLTAKMGTGGNNVPVIVDEHRKFSVEECLRIMGFPESFIIKENYSQSYKQLGNSVIVPIVKEIFESFLQINSVNFE